MAFLGPDALQTVRMGGKGSVTMNDVAREAGVSASTVSLALRGSPRISSATRTRVADLARRLGYQPNPLVTVLMQTRRSPRTGKSALTVGYLSFEAMAPMLRDEPIYAEFERGAFDEARRQGMNLEKLKVGAGLSLPRIDQILRARGAMGVIVSPLPPELTSIQLDWSHLAGIAVGPTLREPELHQVMSNHYENMARLLHACLEWGYRRPGLCLDSPSNERIRGQWEACYLREQTDNPRLEKVPLLKYDSLSAKSLLAWVKRSKPDFIICASPREVQGALREAGLRVPQDVALASVSAARAGGSLSGIVEDGYGAGAQAVSQLLRMIYGNERGLPEKPLKILLPAQVYRGTTC